MEYVVNPHEHFNMHSINWSMSCASAAPCVVKFNQLVDVRNYFLCGQCQPTYVSSCKFV